MGKSIRNYRTFPSATPQCIIYEDPYYGGNREGIKAGHSIV